MTFEGSFGDQQKYTKKSYRFDFQSFAQIFIQSVPPNCSVLHIVSIRRPNVKPRAYHPKLARTAYALVMSVFFYLPLHVV